jgi:hypothetical protein
MCGRVTLDSGEKECPATGTGMIHETGGWCSAGAIAEIREDSKFFSGLALKNIMHKWLLKHVTVIRTEVICTLALFSYKHTVRNFYHIISLNCIRA